MRLGLLITIISAFFIANTYYDGKYVQQLKSWKKYYQMAGIAFAGISAYAFIKKHPSQTTSLVSHANGIIKYMPIDKEASAILTPFLENFNSGNSQTTREGHFTQETPHLHHQHMSGQQKRLVRSGGNSTKRSVSETKKKFVAAEQGWKCGDCKHQLPAWFEVDHKIRLDSGGSNHIDNLVALCRDCHGKKTAHENL